MSGTLLEAWVLQDLLGPGRLTPWFQPVVSTTTRTVHRFEALVRYECPDGRVLLPYQVLPALEQIGQSAGLFPEMLHAALAACRRWRDAGIPAGVAVNVTTDDLRDDELPGLVCAKLNEHDLPASVLMLELSEQQLLVAGDAARDSLSRLRSIGIRIAIDDFGAGHSSLARLADVTVNELKIDRGLVTSADTDPRRQIVLRSAVDLGHRLGLEVVAEGVEDDDVAGTVRAVGADSIQGYLFSKPIPLDDVLRRYAPRTQTTPASEAATTPSARRRFADAQRCRLLNWSAPIRPCVLAGVSIYFALYLMWLLLQPGGREIRVWTGNLAFLPVTAAGIWFAWQAGRSAPPRTRQAWRLLALALVAYTGGDSLQWFYETVLHRSAVPGPADAGFLLFYPLAMAGVLRLGRPLRDRAARRVLVVDVLTVMCGFGALLVEFVFAPAISSGQGVVAKVVASGYPLGDLLLLFAAVNVLLRGAERSARRPLRLLAASATCFVVTDSFYVKLGDYDATSWINSGWILALTGILLAAVAGGPTPDAAAGYQFESSGTRGAGLLSGVPFLGVAAAVGVLAATELWDVTWTQAALWTLATLTAVLMMLRQHAAIHTNIKLVQAYDALSSCDELTGLSTRRHFLAEAERELALSGRAPGSDAGTALVLLDIDHFTAINERYGQQAGDQVLTAVAEACRNQLRQGDLLGRFGGDEIIALLPNSSVETASSITRRIEEHLRGLCIDTTTGPVVACISAGIAFAPAGEGLTEALSRVTTALHDAKQAAGVLSAQSMEPTPVH